MVEVYAVETVLNLKSDVLAQVTRMIRKFEELGEVLKKVQLQFDRLTANIDGAVVASERMKTIQAEIAAETSKTARNYAKITEEQGLASRRAATGGHGSGMAAGIAAAGGAFVMFHAVKTEMEVQKDLAKFQNDKTITAAQSEALRAKAEEMVRVAPGTTMAQNLETLLDVFSVVRDVNKSMSVGVQIAKMNAARVLNGGAESGSYDAVKMLESLQWIYGDDQQPSAEKLAAGLKRIQLVETGFFNRVKSSDMLGLAKQMRLAGFVADPDFIMEDLPAVVQSIGGTRTGTAMSALARAFVVGQMTKPTFEKLQHVGMFDKSTTWKSGRVNDPLKHVIGGDMVARNPETWVTDDLIPLLKKNKVNIDNAQEVAKFIMTHLQTTATEGGALAELVVGREGIAKDKDALLHKITDDPLSNMEKNATGAVALAKFNSALNEFLDTLGGKLTGQATDILSGLAKGLNAVTDWIKANPTAGTFAVKLGEDLTIFLGVIAGAKMLRFVAALAKVGEVVTPFVEGGRAAGAFGTIATGLSGMVFPLLAVAAAVGPAVHAFEAIDAALQKLGIANGGPEKTLDPTQGGVPIEKPGWLPGKGFGTWWKNHLGFGDPGTGPGPDMSHPMTNDPVGKHLFQPPAVDDPKKQSYLFQPPAVDDPKKQSYLFQPPAVDDPKKQSYLFQPPAVDDPKKQPVSLTTLPHKPEPQQITVTFNGAVPIQMDGRTIAQLIMDRIGSQMSRPQGGTSAVDFGMSPISSGQQVAV